MGPIFQGNVETILNMGGVGFVVVFVSMRRRDTFHTIHADSNGVVRYSRGDGGSGGPVTEGRNRAAWGKRSVKALFLLRTVWYDVLS
jgi:hypothetical protein